MIIPPETLAWLRQSAATEGAAYSQVLLIVLERLELLERKYETQRLASLEWGKDVDMVKRWSDDHLRRLEALEQPRQDKLDRLIEQDREDDEHTPEAVPMATDEELRLVSDAHRLWSDSRRALYRLGREHSCPHIRSGGEGTSYCALAEQTAAAQPAPPDALSVALIEAECALSDIAEGAPSTDEGDPVQWAEQRCAGALAIIRPVMQQHGVRTSEWPPAAHPAPPVAPAGGLVERVAAAMHPDSFAPEESWGTEARAAIREVAAWLDNKGLCGSSLRLREEVGR